MDLQTLIERVKIKRPSPEGKYNVDLSFARLMERISNADVVGVLKLNKIYLAWAAAASIALLVSLGFWFREMSLDREVEYAVETNISGKVKDVLLADGSKVKVNVGSRLVYPKEFSSSKREVFLTGEAYFEVAHDKRKPFIVRAGDIGVKVLGTKFNIKAYPNEVNIVTTLLEGSVQIDNSRINQQLTMVPNDVFTYNQLSSSSRLVKLANAKDNIRWLEGVVMMNKMSFEEVCLMMERIYNVRIIVLDEKYKTKNFTGEFRYGEDLTNFLEVLKTTMHFTYTINQQTIILK